MENKIMISIVIPCFNSEKTITRTLLSVASQSYKNYEVVIIDDGSTDRTKKLIEDFFEIYDLNYKYIYQENRGPSKARNLGVSNAVGDYIAFLDSDDTWHKDKLSIQMKLIKENNLNFLGSTYQYSEFNYNENSNIVLKRFTFQELLIKTQFSTPGVVIKKELFLNLGGFDTHMKYSEDNDLWLRASLITDLYLIVEPKLVRLHKRAYGDSGLSGNMFGMYKGELFSLKKFWKQGNLKSLNYVFLIIFITMKLIRRVVKNFLGKN
ncbi:glycosyltransferase family 2 protein [Sulfurimonas marina]|uniref:Glycosyltransferase family 2 protein n=1 Tax=Sulfurimonas marina TaxID=2590551 RepID=A0A7M1AVJ2_9BACT|nr:glycosyltransferase family A protein [Sulfurimonas marina]QOP41457.1 glycosyltransferase family 2 protein [Sulfurimonas marina]